MPTLIDSLVAFVTPPGAPLPGPNYADGQAVYISDLEGNDLFQLNESELPEQGVTVGGELRSTVTRYPGTAKVSTQIMGTQEDDIEIRGWFRDAWTGLDGGAAKQYADLRAFWLRRHRCELSWGQLLVRRGFIKRVDVEFTSERAIKYKIVFQVDEADEPAVIATPFPPSESPFDLLALFAEIGRAVESVSVAAVAINNVARAVI